MHGICFITSLCVGVAANLSFSWQLESGAEGHEKNGPLLQCRHWNSGTLADSFLIDDERYGFR